MNVDDGEKRQFLFFYICEISMRTHTGTHTHTHTHTHCTHTESCYTSFLAFHYACWCKSRGVSFLKMKDVTCPPGQNEFTEKGILSFLPFQPRGSCRLYKFSFSTWFVWEWNWNLLIPVVGGGYQVIYCIYAIYLLAHLAAFWLITYFLYLYSNNSLFTAIHCIIILNYIFFYIVPSQLFLIVFNVQYVFNVQLYSMCSI